MITHDDGMMWTEKLIVELEWRTLLFTVVYSFHSDFLLQIKIHKHRILKNKNKFTLE